MSFKPEFENLLSFDAQTQRASATSLALNIFETVPQFSKDLETPSFEPTDITDLKLWLDGDDLYSITKDGSNLVSQWNDKSGNNNNAAQNTSSSQPSTNTSTRNGLNVLDFSSDFMVSPININRSTMPDLSIFAVFAIKATSGDSFLFGQDNNGWDRVAALQRGDTSTRWGIANASGTIPFTQSRTPDLNYHALSVVLDTGVSNGSLVSLDGASPTVFTEGAGDGHTTTAIGDLRHDGAIPMNAYLAEMIFIDSLVSTSDRQKI